MVQVTEHGQYEYRRFMSPEVSLKALPIDRSQDIALDENCDWLKEILDELNEESGEANLQSYETFLKLELSMKRKSHSEFGDYLILEGSVDLKYATSCVVTGDTIVESQDTEIFAAVLDKPVIKDQNLEEETEIYINDAEYDLYDYEFKVDLKSIIREYVFLNKNYYPKKEVTES